MECTLLTRKKHEKILLLLSLTITGANAALINGLKIMVIYVLVIGYQSYQVQRLLRQKQLTQVSFQLPRPIIGKKTIKRQKKKKLKRNLKKRNMKIKLIPFVIE